MHDDLKLQKFNMQRSLLRKGDSTTKVAFVGHVQMSITGQECTVNDRLSIDEIGLLQLRCSMQEFLQWKQNQNVDFKVTEATPNLD